MIVGVDVGGTKTHVRAEGAGRVIFDDVFPTASWQRGELLDEPENATRMLSLTDAAGLVSASPLVVGAHGLDSERQRREFETLLARYRDGPVRAVNDVELLGPAAGLVEAIAVVAGTGSKVVGHRADGTLLAAGGHGFLLGDPGSAPALARDAVRAVLAAQDRGADVDPLGERLMAHFQVGDLVAMSYAFTGEPRMTRWASAGTLVFEAAAVGSELAEKVIDRAAVQLASDVRLVHSRGAVGSDVVCAGGVLAHQSRMFEAVEYHIGELRLGLDVRRLTAPPVAGAMALAARLERPVR